MSRRRWSCALAALGAWVLAMQSMGLPLLAAAPAAACCCARHDARCKCRSCTHARELESGQSCLRTCGSEEAGAVAPAIEPFVPRAVVLPASPPAREEIFGSAAACPPVPPIEVPTPPPETFV
ncbi:MAG: hypothetical protein E6J78_01190 [Deltaproteobacteria bacterium]|nr:MAG: hypothetical protein E6J78_01190 [Deltaproteobacteria bacterium]